MRETTRVIRPVRGEQEMAAAITEMASDYSLGACDLWSGLCRRARVGEGTNYPVMELEAECGDVGELPEASRALRNM
jgi:hypothetical protein